MFEIGHFLTHLSCLALAFQDFKAFCNALERYGRYDFPAISRDVVAETGKELNEVQRYFVAFWTNYRRIAEWKKIIERVEKGEKKILRLRQIREAIQEKVERHIEDTFASIKDELVKVGEDGKKKMPSATELLQASWPQMQINYGPGTRSRAYQEEEDAFLIAMMYRHGYGAAERIRMEIRRAWQFRFDWYFKSRTGLEIQKRCDLLVKVIEKENEEIRKMEKEEEQKRLADQQPPAVAVTEGVPPPTATAGPATVAAAQPPAVAQN